MSLRAGEGGYDEAREQGTNEQVSEKFAGERSTEFIDGFVFEDLLIPAQLVTIKSSGKFSIWWVRTVPSLAKTFHDPHSDAKTIMSSAVRNGA